MTVTIDDAPQPPSTLRLEFLNSERARILAAVKKRGGITKEEAEILNRTAEKKVHELLAQFEESLLKQMEITPNDTPKEIEFKMNFADQITQWLKKLFSWLEEKIKQIFSKLKEAAERCFKKAKELFDYLWSLFE